MALMSYSVPVFTAAPHHPLMAGFCFCHRAFSRIETCHGATAFKEVRKSSNKLLYELQESACQSVSMSVAKSTGRASDLSDLSDLSDDR